MQAALELEEESVRIKVYGDGPFILPPTSIRSPDVEIVAAKGYRPVIKSDVADRNEQAMITTNSRLRVEGLVYEMVLDSDSDDENLLIACEAGSFSAVDCRFVVEPGGACIDAVDSDLELLECEIYSSQGAGVLWMPEHGDRMTVRHCVFAGNGAIQISAAGEAKVVLADNRFVVATALQLELSDQEEFQLESDDEGAFLDIEASRNVFDSEVLISFLELPVDRHELLAMVAWRGRENAFWGQFVSIDSWDDMDEANLLIDTLDHWREIEAVEERNSRRTRPRYHTDRAELRDRLRRGSKLRADDFRLLGRN